MWVVLVDDELGHPYVEAVCATEERAKEARDRAAAEVGKGERLFMEECEVWS